MIFLLFKYSFCYKFATIEADRMWVGSFNLNELLEKNYKVW
jgi:hypothetical protein